MKTDLYNCKSHTIVNQLLHWCPEKQSYLQDKEALDFWESVNGSENEESKQTGFTVAVPIVPTLRVWTNVWMKLDEKIDTVLLVKWENNFLCYLTAGEGRMVIRNCIIDILRSEELTCTAYHHNFQAEAENKKYTENAPEYWRNKLYLHATGHCYICNSGVFSSLSKDENALMAEDLIPSKEGAF